jgi:Tfp pilus assembly protein PilF
MSSPLIEEGLAALRDGDTATARRVLEVAVTEAESGEALEGLAEVLYLEREYAASAARYERAYTAYRRERERMGLPREASVVQRGPGSP